MFISFEDIHNTEIESLVKLKHLFRLFQEEEDVILHKIIK